MLKVGDKFYFTRHGEDLYRELGRLTNPHGSFLVHGVFEVVKVGRKRYHLEPLWIETEISCSNRYYRYQEDLVHAINNCEDTITRFTGYSIRTIPFQFLDQLFELGEIAILDESEPWTVAFAKQYLTDNASLHIALEKCS